MRSGLIWTTSINYRVAEFGSSYGDALESIAAVSGTNAPGFVFEYGDYGAPAVTGLTTGITSGTDYNMSAGGTGFLGTSDQFQFAWQQLSGDFDIRAKVSMTGGVAGSMAGLMARVSLDANSIFGFFGVAQSSTNSTFETVNRTSTGGTPGTWTTGFSPTPGTFGWIRLQRVGNQIREYGSTNGVQWIYWAYLNLPTGTGAIYVGMAGAAGDSTHTATAQFRSLSATPVQTGVTLTGTSGDDILYLRLDATQTYLQVWNHLPIDPDDPADPPDQTYIYNQIDSLTINTLAGDDTVYFDFGNGTFYFNQHIAYNGGDGNDTEVVLGSTSTTVWDTFVRYSTYDYFVNGPDYYCNAKIDFTGLEHHLFDGRGGWDGYKFTAGNWTVDTDLGTDNPNLNLVVYTGANVTFSTSQSIFFLWTDGGEINITGSDTHLSLQLLANTSGWDMNLNGGVVTEDYTGTSPAASFLAWLAEGYDGGLWDGGGFYSLQAACTNGATGIGWAEASDLLGLSGSQTATWDGITVDATTLLFKYTFVGDMNLDGMVDSTDYDLWDTAVANSSPASWITGDFNYDGVRDSTDYAMMNYAYAHQDDPVAHMLADINPGSASSAPSNFININGILYFTADDGIHGTELWMSDGTLAGTVMVADINSGSGSSSPYSLTNVDGTLYFIANDGTHGYELWKSDGTESGTVMVKDIISGSVSSWPSYLTDVDGTLFFTAYDSVHGNQLWKSDGMTSGTVMVTDIEEDDSYLENPTSAGDGNLFFWVLTDEGDELWFSDGTGTGTTMVQQFTSMYDDLDPTMVNVDGTMFFMADDGTHGTELWTSDGTTAGTSMVKDIWSGSEGSYPNQLINVDGVIYFEATDPLCDGQLWRSDGTSAGTYMVKDISGDGEASYPNSFVAVDGELYFSAYDSTHGYELWMSDGTESGTVMVTDINAGSAGSNPQQITDVGGTIYFSAYGTHGWELWKSDGTSSGTTPVAPVSPGSLTNVNGVLFFAANDGANGLELWVLPA